MAGSISGGDLTAKIEIKSNDEIGRLASAINQVADNLRGILEETKALVEKGSMISEEVGLSATSVLGGPRKQQANLDEMSLSIEGMDNRASELATCHRGDKQGVRVAEEMNRVIRSPDGLTKSLVVQMERSRICGCSRI